MRSIELFIVFPVTSFHFSIVSGRVRLNQFVANTKALELGFKGSKRVAAFGQQALCKLCTVVSLHTLNRVREAFYNMLKK